MKARPESASSPSYDYFASVSERRPAYPAPPQESASKGRFRLMYVLIAMALMCAVVLGVNIFRGSEPGSREDLASRLNALEPSSMKQTREIFSPEENCPTSATLCPSLVRWYSIAGPIGAAREAVISRLQAKGLAFEQNDIEPNLIVVRERHHIYYLVFHEQPLDGPFDNVLPPSVEADWSIIHGGPYSTSP